MEPQILEHYFEKASRASTVRDCVMGWGHYFWRFFRFQRMITFQFLFISHLQHSVDNVVKTCSLTENRWSRAEIDNKRLHHSPVFLRIGHLLCGLAEDKHFWPNFTKWNNCGVSADRFAGSLKRKAVLLFSVTKCNLSKDNEILPRRTFLGDWLSCLIRDISQSCVWVCVCVIFKKTVIDGVWLFFCNLTYVYLLLSWFQSFCLRDVLVTF